MSVMKNIEMEYQNYVKLPFSQIQDSNALFAILTFTHNHDIYPTQSFAENLQCQNMGIMTLMGIFFHKDTHEATFLRNDHPLVLQPTLYTQDCVHTFPGSDLSRVLL